MKILKGFLIIVFWGGLQSSVVGQNWDYEKYPLQTVEFQHLDAEIRIGSDGNIEGDILYNIRFRTDDTDSLVLDATRIDIGGVAVNEMSREYRLEKDHLIIFLENDSEKGASGTLRIQYYAEPAFALHHSLNQSVWTSLLPKSVRHWLPVADHPRTTFTTEMIFTHPAGQTLISNGRKSETEILSVEEEVTTYRSNRPVSASTLAWALGDFSLEGSTTTMSFEGIPEIGNTFQRRTDPQIYFYSEVARADTESLMNVAAEAFQNVQSFLDYKYPFRDLQIILLEDGKWETKTWGSGYIYIFNDRSNLREQIQNGILSQWFGVYVREIQWSDAGAVNALRGFISDELFEFDTEYEKSPPPYNVFSDYNLWLWQNYLADSENSILRNYLSDNISIILSGNGAALGWQELSEIMYENTGRPFSTNPTPVEPEAVEDNPVEYVVEMDWNEDESTVRLNFEAIGEGAGELITIHAEEIRLGETVDNEITITGNSESVVMNVSRGIENLKLGIRDRDDILLTERKPFLFWIHQLRNDANVNRRVEAAQALSQFPDNPDLQLVFTDLFRIETSPRVYAEMLKSLSSITMGASGTEQMFLDRTGADQPLEVQKAAVEGLAFYQNNDRVTGRLRGIITETENREIRKAAIRSLFEVTDAETFRSISEAVVTTEAVLPEVPLILNLLAEKEQTDAALRLSDTFLDNGFPSDIRIEALLLLLKYDDSESQWEERLPGLLADSDPRIRFHAAGGLEKISRARRDELVTVRLVEEYDERVRRQLQ